MPPTRPLQGRTRILLQAALIVIGVVMVALPPLVVGLSGNASLDALWTALRVTALEALTLVSAGVVVGAFRPVLARVLKNKPLHRIHVTLGVGGYGLAIAHGVMVAVFGVSGYGPGRVWILPVAVLAVLLLLVASALARRRLRRYWRWFHRLSYPLLAVILLHAFQLGYDLGGGVTMKVCFSIYAAAAAAGLAYRITSWLRTTQTDKRPT